jgi:hypothetical protein
MALRCDATGGTRTQVWSNGDEAQVGGSSAGTVAAWIKVRTDSSATGDRAINWSGNSAYISHSATANEYQVVLVTGAGNAGHTLSLAADTWAHVAITWDTSLGDGERQKIYVNGSKVATADHNSAVSAASRLSFGEDGAGGTDQSYSEVAAWSRALSGAEITTLQTSQADAVSSGLAWYFNFTQQTTGTASNTDTGFDEQVGSANCPDLVVRGGTNVWDSDDPLAATDPAVTCRLISGCSGTIADAGSVDLGNLKIGQDQSVRLQITNNGGGDDLTGISVGVTGNGTLASTASPSDIAIGETSDIVVDLSTATAGTGRSTVVAVGSSELSDLVYTINYDVREDSDRTVTKGAGFSSPPSTTPTTVGSGVAYQVSGVIDIPNHYWVDAGTIECCVCADHKDPGFIDRIEIYFESDTISKTIYTMGRSLRTGAVGYTFTLDSDETDGAHDIKIRVVPVNGQDRWIEQTIHFNGQGTHEGSSLYWQPGNSSATGGSGTEGSPYNSLRVAFDNVSDGDRLICTTSGTDTSLDNLSSNATLATKPCIVELGSGLSYGDVIVTMSDRSGAGTAGGSIRARTNAIVWKNIRFDMAAIQGFYGGGTGGIGGHWIFEECGWYDSNGTMGPSDYYYKPELGPTFRQTEGVRYAVLSPREWGYVRGPTGCSMYINTMGTTIEFTQDAYLGSAQGDLLFVHYDIEEQGVGYVRLHEESSLTVATASYDGGSGETTITLSGTPTLMETFGAQDSDIVVLTGSLATNTYALVSQVDATDTIVVDGDASGLSGGDTIRTREIPHADAFQLNESSSDYDNIIINNGFWNIDTSQAFLPQPASTYDVLAFSIQNVAIRKTGSGGLALFERGFENLVARSLTYIGNNDGARWVWSTGASGYDPRNSLLIDSVFNNLNDSTVNTVEEINNHYETGDTQGLAATSGETTGIDADTLRPSGSGVVDSRLYLSRLSNDRLGIQLSGDGSMSIGAMQSESMVADVFSSFTATDGGGSFVINFSAAVSYTLGNGPSVRLYRSAENDRQSASLFGSPIVIPASASGITSLTCTLSTGTLDADLFYWVDLNTSGSDMSRDSDSAPVASIEDEPMTVTGGGPAVAVGSRDRGRASVRERARGGTYR